MVGRKDNFRLLGLLFAIVMLAIGVLEITKTIEKDKSYDKKVLAAMKMRACTNAIRDRKIALGIEINPESDFNNTGMIGADFTFMTTTVGSPEAKRTSASPDVAAMLVDMLVEAGVSTGDLVATNFSSSFPSFNIATIVACEALGAKPVIISSIGSSTYGANQEGFIYIEMEQHLYDLGLIKNKSVAVSLGGDLDIGKNMLPESRDIVVEKVLKSGITYIEAPIYSENIAQRIAIYDSYGEYTCFVNAGGNWLATGEEDGLINMNGGVWRKKNVQLNEKSGLIEIFLSRGLPVVHLLNMRDLATKYQLPYDPRGFPPIGSGAIYYSYNYNKFVAFVAIVIIIIGLIVYKKRRRIDGKHKNTLHR